MKRLCFILMTMIFTGAAGADEAYANQQHSSFLIFSATAYSFQDGQEPSRAEDLARNRAISFGLENCRQYLKDAGLTEKDYEFLPGEDGKLLRILDSSRIDANRTGKQLAGIRIIGEVQLRTNASVVQSAKGPLQVSVSGKKDQYRKDDEIIFTIQGNKGFYGNLINQNATGEIIQLLPNRLKKTVYFEETRPHLFPDQKRGETFHLIVDEPYGNEKIFLFASTEEFEPLLDRYKGVFGTIKESMNSVRDTLTAHLVKTLQAHDARVTFYCLPLSIAEMEFSTAP